MLVSKFRGYPTIEKKRARDYGEDWNSRSRANSVMVVLSLLLSLAWHGMAWQRIMATRKAEDQKMLVVIPPFFL